MIFIKNNTELVPVLLLLNSHIFSYKHLHAWEGLHVDICKAISSFLSSFLLINLSVAIKFKKIENLGH